MALIPENATFENKVEFQDLCQIFNIQCYIIKSECSEIALVTTPNF